MCTARWTSWVSNASSWTHKDGSLIPVIKFFLHLYLIPSSRTPNRDAASKMAAVPDNDMNIKKACWSRARSVANIRQADVTLQAIEQMSASKKKNLIKIIAVCGKTCTTYGISCEIVCAKTLTLDVTLMQKWKQGCHKLRKLCATNILPLDRAGRNYLPSFPNTQNGQPVDFRKLTHMEWRQQPFYMFLSNICSLELCYLWTWLFHLELSKTVSLSLFIPDVENIDPIGYDVIGLKVVIDKTSGWELVEKGWIVNHQRASRGW